VAAELTAAGGRLRLVDELARGGMGSVFLALRDDDGFRRAYAVKRLHAALRDEADAVGRFLDEAAIAAELRHPNVVSVLDVGADDEGPFIVMELVVGMSLREIRDALRARRRELPLQVGLRILSQVAEALRAAHAYSMVHRDVSPGNVVVGFDGSVRLIDFGLAKAVDDPRTRDLLRGTTGYMSPEQLRFEPIDARSDLFSLGVLLVESVRGDRLYGDEDARLAARRILGEPPPDLRRDAPEIADDLAELVSELLAKDPDARPDRTEVVCARLRRALHERIEDEGVVDLSRWMETTFGDEIARRRAELSAHWRASPRRSSVGAQETPVIRPRRRARARWWAMPLTMVAVAGLSAAVVLAVRDRDPPPDAATRPPPATPASPDPAPQPEPVAPPEPPVARAAALDAGAAEPADDESSPRRRRRRRGPPEVEGDRALWEW